MICMRPIAPARRHGALIVVGLDRARPRAPVVRRGRPWRRSDRRARGWRPSSGGGPAAAGDAARASIATACAYGTSSGSSSAMMLRFARMSPPPGNSRMTVSPSNVHSIDIHRPAVLEADDVGVGQGRKAGDQNGSQSAERPRRETRPCGRCLVHAVVLTVEARSDIGPRWPGPGRGRRPPLVICLSSYRRSSAR